MSVAYRMLYKVGFTPWEQMATSQPLVGADLRVVRPRGGGRPAAPRAGARSWLRERDLTVKLAERGWQVTGVDLIPKALRSARERAREAGVEVRLIEGDVTALDGSGVGSGYQLLVDFGCFHDELSDAQREQDGREASAAAAAGES